MDLLFTAVLCVCVRVCVAEEEVKGCQYLWECENKFGENWFCILWLKSSVFTTKLSLSYGFTFWLPIFQRSWQVLLLQEGVFIDELWNVNPIMHHSISLLVRICRRRSYVPTDKIQARRSWMMKNSRLWPWDYQLKEKSSKCTIVS